MLFYICMFQFYSIQRSFWLFSLDVGQVSNQHRSVSNWNTKVVYFKSKFVVCDAYMSSFIYWFYILTTSILLGFSIWTYSLQHSLEDESLNKKDNSTAELDKSDLDSILTQSEDNQPQHAQEPPSLISFEATEAPAQIEVIRQPSPPPILAEVQDLVPAVSPHINEAGCKTEIPSSDSCVHAETPLQLHIVSQ